MDAWTVEGVAAALALLNRCAYLLAAIVWALGFVIGFAIMPFFQLMRGPGKV